MAHVHQPIVIQRCGSDCYCLYQFIRAALDSSRPSSQIQWSVNLRLAVLASTSMGPSACVLRRGTAQSFPRKSLAASDQGAEPSEDRLPKPDNVLDQIVRT